MMDKIARLRQSVPPDFLTVEEVAMVLGLGRTATYGHVRTGVIPAERYGKQFRIPRAALERALGGPLTWPPTPAEPSDAQRVASAASPTRPRNSKRRPSGEGQSSLPFSA